MVLLGCYVVPPGVPCGARGAIVVLPGVPSSDTASLPEATGQAHFQEPQTSYTDKLKPTIRLA